MEPNSSHIQSAIIGMWRMGAPAEEIAQELSYPLFNVKEIIERYKNNRKIKLKKDKTH